MNTLHKKTIGILYPGDMGAAVAMLLRAQGHRVVSTLEGRGVATRRRAEGSGIELLPSLGDVVSQSQIVISLVPPAAAQALADRCSAEADRAPAGAIFADANSISPEQSIVIGESMTSAGFDYVDMCINGLAPNLTTSGTVFVSGPRRGDIAALFGDAARVVELGSSVGQASTMKMLLGGLSKGICALYIELAALAAAHGMVPEMFQAVTKIYPGMQLVIDRMLPTYAHHAARRATEMQELEACAEASNVQPRIISALRELHEAIAEAALDLPQGKATWTAAEIIEPISRAARAADLIEMGKGETQTV
jgi:3-hydroxyisobutyrate dehydrogenase-like beta-hydroxyacid dehydrogenase